MQKKLVLTATILGSAMTFIDATAVNVAMPVLQKDLHATLAEAQWVVESYQLLLASLLLVGGALGDRFGRRRLFLLGVTLFALTSLWCGLAPTIGWLIVARSVQGIAAALLMPESLAIVSASFDDQERGRAIGLWSSLTALMVLFGPVLGGWLIDHGSWRWLFFINLPIGVVTIVLTMIGVEESRDPNNARLDLIGSVLVTSALGAIVYPLIEWPHANHAFLSMIIAAGVVLLIVFALFERKSRSPMLPPSLFRSRTFSAANLLTLFLYAALGAAMFFLPFNLIDLQHFTATEAGAANLPLVVLVTLLSPLSGKWASKHGWRLPLIVGPSIAAIGFALFALPGVQSGYWRGFFPAAIVLGLGMAITVAPLTTAVMSSAGRDRAGVASGVNNAVARAAGLLAIALIGLIVTAVFRQGLQTMAPTAHRADLVAQSAKLTAISLPSSLGEEESRNAHQAIQLAFLRAFRWGVLSCAGMAAVAAFCGTQCGKEEPGS